MKGNHKVIIEDHCLKINYYIQSKKIKNHVRMIALPFQVTSNLVIYTNYRLHQSDLGFGKDTRMVSLCKFIVDGCPYA